MSPISIRRVFISFFLAIAGFSSAFAQTISVNNALCPSATVTYGAGTIAINTGGCGTTVTATAPTITSGAPTSTGSMGAAYNFQFQATGSATIAWTIASGAQPAGLTLSSGGLLSGTPTTPGTYTFTVQAANGTTPNAVSASYSIVITNLPAITSAAPATATVGVAYSFTFTASQSIATTWLATGLPTWATLNATTGVLSGTPNAVGQPTITVSATNANGTATQNYTLNVITLTAPTITGATPPAGTANTAYSYTFAAAGTAPINWTVASGTTPTGLTLATSGVLSGTPTTAGTYTFTVQAANGTTPNATSGTLSIVIAPAVTQSSTGAILQDISSNVIPRPVSRVAKAVIAQHPGLNGGSSYGWNGWAPDPARCRGTPAITRYWYHNIDIVDYGGQNALDYLDFAPNEAVTFGFVPTLKLDGSAQVGKIWVMTNNFTSAATFLSISTSPCDFDMSKVAAADPCYVTGQSENSMMFQATNAATSPVCKLTPGTQYYLNVRFQDARSGAPAVDSCAGALAGSGYTHCGANLQVFTY